jgi:hypothetical protein
MKQRTSVKIIKQIVAERLDTSPKACLYPECDVSIEARGLCKRHYSFYQRVVRPTFPGEKYKYAGEPDYAALVGDPCSMCGEPSVSVGLCKRHYARNLVARNRLNTLEEWAE